MGQGLQWAGSVRRLFACAKATASMYHDSWQCPLRNHVPGRRYFAFRGQMAATANALCLSRSLKQRMWDDSVQVGLPPQRLLALVRALQGLSKAH